MKAEELRTGNWVMHSNGTPMQVTRISGGNFACGTPHCWCYNNVFNPIKLTTDILNKNFEIDKWNKKHWVVGNMWHIWENPNYGFILGALEMDEFGGGYYVPCIPCTYFHELQNLMVDLRIDKKIEL